MNTYYRKNFWRQWLVLLLLTLSSSLIAGGAIAAAKPSLSLSKVSWSAKTNQLIIQGSLKNSAAGIPIAINDLDGRLLATVTPTSPKFSLTLDNNNLPDIPCSIRAQAGNMETVKVVAGNPNKACKAAPTCQISIANGVNNPNVIHVDANNDVAFAALAKFSNKNAQPKYEWDFGGGAMGENDSKNAAVDSYKRATGTSTTVKFIRDNSHYRVHFSAVDGSVAAMESKQYRCEDTVDVTVGNPPETPSGVVAMVTAAQQSAPKLGKELEGKKGDLVVLPYEDLTLQCTDDTRTAPVGYLGGSMSWAGINAVVYQKDLKSPQRTDVTLRYTATSNPTDPAGVGSINSTSQNWPLGSAIRDAASPYADATIAKTDRWDSSMMPANSGTNLDAIGTYGRWSPPTTPDQGYTMLGDPNNVFQWPVSVPLPPTDSEHGQRMPGFADPYAVNDAQDFSGYSDLLQAYQSRWLPLTDVDDSGRINPFPLLRIQAFEGDGGNAVATVDAVQTSGRDFHCRECHANGKIGASDSGNVNKTWKDAAYNYSVYNQDTNSYGGNKVNVDTVAPEFVDSMDKDGNASSHIADQEFAAILNTAKLHDFYDGVGMNSTYSGGYKGVATCALSCHTDANVMERFQAPTELFVNDLEAVSPLPNVTKIKYDTNYSMNMHKWHGQLQYNDNKDGILRDANGVPQRWQASSYNNKTLFPVKDGNGKPLPMEQNCLKCHAGQREQCYRDRMYTAGVTCYQCHGDMLAVGQAFPKKQPASDGHKKRLDWHDQPDCGSCHVGSANVGKANADFFSAGVRNLAFDKNDPSATTLPVDRSNPDAARFAVPATPAELNILQAPYDYSNGGAFAGLNNILRFDGPLYRLGKDTHGNVPCGACHGGAHAVWPNRDPNANDNVTALQLQGHVGQILECNVCHDKDAFKLKTDLDGSAVYSGDPKPFILGGPHNTHPINDPYWWKDSKDPGDVTAIDGSTYGGWHNNYALIPGKAGEDQCAACHGNDHKGTRLSRTPVDRVFDFSDFDFAKLKKVGFKSKVIKVAAGTPIGCNTCHSIQTSCPSNSPAGAQCGIDSATTTASTNHAPVFTAAPDADAKSFVIGQSAPYSYLPKVQDPDSGDALTFGLSTRLDNMSIDATTGKVSLPNWDAITKGWLGSGQQLPYTYSYMVTVTDGKGGYASQQVPVTIACPAGKVWGYDAVKGAGDCLTNTLPSLIVPPLPAAVVGEAFGATFHSTDPDYNGGRLQTPLYTLTGEPSGMTLGNINGVLKWTPDTAGTFTFAVAVNDQVGGSDSATITVHVCAAGNTYSKAADACVANHSPVINSTPSLTFRSGEQYIYSVDATDADSDAMSYSLYQPVTGMNLVGNVLSWMPNQDQVTAGAATATLLVTDGKGGIAIQSLDLHLCDTGQNWDGGMGMCMGATP